MTNINKEESNPYVTSSQSHRIQMRNFEPHLNSEGTVINQRLKKIESIHHNLYPRCPKHIIEVHEILALQ